MLLQLLYFPGCPAAPLIREAILDALRALELDAVLQEIDLDRLPPRDPRKGWGSPTILMDGRDLYGRERPTAAGVGVRFYPEGLPDAASLIHRLSLGAKAGPSAA